MESMAPSTGHLTPGFADATAADAMHPWVLTCDPATPLVTVAQRMAGERVHAIVVLSPPDGERSPWGVVTAGDLLRHAKRVEELTAGEIASRDVVEAFADEPLEDVSTRMARRAVTHALVLDRSSGRPVGILSTLDIASVLAWGQPRRPADELRSSLAGLQRRRRAAPASFASHRRPAGVPR